MLSLKIIKLSFIVLLVDSIFLLNIYNLFNKQIIKVQGSPIQVNLLGAFMSYVFVILPLYWFIIKEKKSNLDAFILGISLYGLYEYTTLGIVKNWEVQTTIIDTLWGGCLFVIVKNIFENCS
jgi:uncharacterized membrane protein